MIRKFIAAFVLSFFLLSATAFAAVEPGEVLQATGVSLGSKNWDKNDSFYKTFARQAARMEALNQLAEMIGGVYSEKDKKNPNQIIIRAKLNRKASELLKNHARQVGEAKFSFNDDGSFYCEVTMEVVMPAGWKK